MDRLALIATATALLCSWIVALGLAGRGRARRRSVAESATRLAARLTEETARADALAAAEREASWSARALARIADERERSLAEIADALEASQEHTARIEATVDTLRDDLRVAEADVVSTRRDLEATSTRLAELETELASPDRDDSGLRHHVTVLQEELAETRRSVARHATEARELRHRLAAAQRAAATPSSRTVDDLTAELEELRQHALDPALPERIDELESALAEARSRVAELTDRDGNEPALRAELEKLHATVAAFEAAARDAGELRRELEAAAAGLATRIAAAERESSELRTQLRQDRAESERLRAAAEEARREADRRVAAAGARITELEKSARSGDRDAGLVTVRDAVIADLEQRLAALGAARNAELKRLNEKIASMEHLYVDVEVRDRRITLLEEELKDTAEVRDAALAEIASTERQIAELRSAHAEATLSLARFAGLEHDLLSAHARIIELEEMVAGDSLGIEVERLRSTLQAERDRADRAVQRAALADERPTTYAEWDSRVRERVDAAVAEAVAPLQARIDHLHAVVMEKERRLATLGVRTTLPAGPDDLTRIRGIGPKISAILRDLGISTFRDIAAFTDDDVKRIGGHLPVYGGRIIDDDWIAQARDLAG